MKQLYLIGGTMGVGKTTLCQILKQKLPHSVFLDGDWCWDASPFVVTEETKAMVLDNIRCLLNNFLRCSAYENVIFCWVMHEQSIIDEILGGLDLSSCEVHVISLVCSAEELQRRLERDVANGVREVSVIERSLARLPLYEALQTERIDVSTLSPSESADAIITTCHAKKRTEDME